MNKSVNLIFVDETVATSPLFQQQLAKLNKEFLQNHPVTACVLPKENINHSDRNEPLPKTEFQKAMKEAFSKSVNLLEPKKV